MAGRVRSKRNTYYSPGEFERDRRKVWRDGWLITNRRDVSAKVPLSISGVALIGGAVLPVVFMIAGILWLFNKTQPEQLIVIDYAREGDR